jgi:ATP adenylyltransferase
VGDPLIQVEVLHAPWRSNLFKKSPYKKGCIFCSKIKEKKDKKNLILFRSKRAFILLNLYPYNDGHLMVAPYSHVGDPKKLSSEEWCELHELSRLAIKALEKTFHPDGFNLGMNLGKAAGAGVAEHLHLHVVPRWIGDTNFLPILGETKVLNHSLTETYRKLKPFFRKPLNFMGESWNLNLDKLDTNQ